MAFIKCARLILCFEIQRAEKTCDNLYELVSDIQKVKEIAIFRCYMLYVVLLPRGYLNKIIWLLKLNTVYTYPPCMKSLYFESPFNCM